MHSIKKGDLVVVKTQSIGPSHLHFRESDSDGQAYIKLSPNDRPMLYLGSDPDFSRLYCRHRFLFGTKILELFLFVPHFAVEDYVELARKEKQRHEPD